MVESESINQSGPYKPSANEHCTNQKENTYHCDYASELEKEPDEFRRWILVAGPA